MKAFVAVTMSISVFLILNGILAYSAGMQSRFGDRFLLVCGVWLVFVLILLVVTTVLRSRLRDKIGSYCRWLEACLTMLVLAAVFPAHVGINVSSKYRAFKAVADEHPGNETARVWPLEHRLLNVSSDTSAQRIATNRQDVEHFLFKQLRKNKGQAHDDVLRDALRLFLESELRYLGAETVSVDREKCLARLLSLEHNPSFEEFLLRLGERNVRFPYGHLNALRNRVKASENGSGWDAFLADFLMARVYGREVAAPDDLQKGFTPVAAILNSKNEAEKEQIAGVLAYLCSSGFYSSKAYIYSRPMAGEIERAWGEHWLVAYLHLLDEAARRDSIDRADQSKLRRMPEVVRLFDLLPSDSKWRSLMGLKLSFAFGGSFEDQLPEQWFAQVMRICPDDELSHLHYMTSDRAISESSPRRIRGYYEAVSQAAHLGERSKLYSSSAILRLVERQNYRLNRDKVFSPQAVREMLGAVEHSTDERLRNRIRWYAAGLAYRIRDESLFYESVGLTSTLPHEDYFGRYGNASKLSPFLLAERGDGRFSYWCEQISNGQFGELSAKARDFKSVTSEKYDIAPVVNAWGYIQSRFDAGDEINLLDTEWQAGWEGVGSLSQEGEGVAVNNTGPLYSLRHSVKLGSNFIVKGQFELPAEARKVGECSGILISRGYNMSLNNARIGAGWNRKSGLFETIQNKFENPHYMKALDSNQKKLTFSLEVTTESFRYVSENGEYVGDMEDKRFFPPHDGSCEIYLIGFADRRRKESNIRYQKLTVQKIVK